MPGAAADRKVRLVGRLLKWGIGTGDLRLQTRPAVPVPRASEAHAAAQSSSPLNARIMARTHAASPARNTHALKRVQALGSILYRTSSAAPAKLCQASTDVSPVRACHPSNGYISTIRAAAMIRPTTATYSEKTQSHVRAERRGPCNSSAALRAGP